MKCFPKTVTATGLFYTGSCWFVNMKIGMDNANDPQITVYDSIDGAGTPTELAPTNPYDASQMGLSGISQDNSYAKRGIWLVVTAVGGGAYPGAADITIGIWPSNIPDALNPF